MTTILDKSKTAKIFNHLRDGSFLSQNSPNASDVKLFNYVDKYYEELSQFFEYIDINITLRDGYCYIASTDNQEQKLKTIVELIDILDFFYHYNPMFGVGFKFSISDVEERIKDDTTLKYKLNKLKILSGETLRLRLISLIDKLKKRGFVALDDEYLQKYLVLNSCDYLVEFFNKIDIKE